MTRKKTGVWTIIILKLWLRYHIGIRECAPLPPGHAAVGHRYHFCLFLHRRPRAYGMCVQILAQSRSLQLASNTTIIHHPLLPLEQFLTKLRWNAQIRRWRSGRLFERATPHARPVDRIYRVAPLGDRHPDSGILWTVVCRGRRIGRHSPIVPAVGEARR